MAARERRGPGSVPPGYTCSIAEADVSTEPMMLCAGSCRMASESAARTRTPLASCVRWSDVSDPSREHHRRVRARSLAWATAGSAPGCSARPGAVSTAWRSVWRITSRSAALLDARLVTLLIDTTMRTRRQSMGAGVGAAIAAGATEPKAAPGCAGSKERARTLACTAARTLRSRSLSKPLRAGTAPRSPSSPRVMAAARRTPGARSRRAASRASRLPAGRVRAISCTARTRARGAGAPRRAAMGPVML